MPPLPSVPQVLKVATTWHVDGNPMAATIQHIRYTGGPPSPANCASMAAAFVGNGFTAFALLAGNTVGMDSCMVTDLTTPASGQGSGGSAWVGSGGTALLAPGTAALVNHQISRRYRGGKPRTYLPLGVSSDVNTSGLWTTAFVAAVEAAYGVYVVDCLGSGIGCSLDKFVNVSYYEPPNVVITNPVTGRVRNQSTRRATPLIDVINSDTVAQKIASQRRRNRDA